MRQIAGLVERRGSHAMLFAIRSNGDEVMVWCSIENYRREHPSPINPREKNCLVRH
jgi:hypothetical protein